MVPGRPDYPLQIIPGPDLRYLSSTAQPKTRSSCYTVGEYLYSPRYERLLVLVPGVALSELRRLGGC